MKTFEFVFDDFALSFLSILFEGLPFLLLGVLISGILDAFLPAGIFERFNPRRPTAGIVLAALLPMILPMCECGVVPVVRRLIRKGIPPVCAIAYLIAAPIVNPIVALSTFAAFNGGFGGGSGAIMLLDGATPGMMVALRLFLGFLVAILAASIALQFRPESFLAPNILNTGLTRTGLLVVPEGNGGLRPTFSGRCAAALRCAGTDFIDVAFFLAIGAAITAVFNTAVNQEVIYPVASSPVAATAALMALAFVLSLCSTSDAFIAATFVTFPLASKLAFLVYGPIVDIKLIFLYGLVFKKRVVAGFAIVAFALVGALCLRLAEVMR